MFGFERTAYDKKVYEEQLKDFLPETFIDIHTHIWKKEFDGQDHTKGCVSWTKLVSDQPGYVSREKGDSRSDGTADVQCVSDQ